MKVHFRLPQRKWIARGCLYLTSLRMVFVANSPKPPIVAFDIPLVRDLGYLLTIISCIHQILQMWKRSYMRFAAHSVAWTSPAPLRAWYLLCLLHSSFSAKRNSTSQYSEPTTYLVKFFRYDIVISDTSTASWPSQPSRLPLEEHYCTLFWQNLQKIRRSSWEKQLMH